MIETLSLMIATIPIVAALSFNKIWFGVLIEMALITPSLGLNL